MPKTPIKISSHKTIVMRINLYKEHHGTFGTKYYLEIQTDRYPTIIEIAQFQFDQIKEQQIEYNVLPDKRDVPLDKKLTIEKKRETWNIYRERY